MKQYRATENGVELIGENCSTFIPPDPTSNAWRQFLAWRSRGHTPEVALRQPGNSVALKNLWIVGAGGFGREVFTMAASARGAAGS